MKKVRHYRIIRIFPRDEALCKQWVKLIGPEGWKPKGNVQAVPMIFVKEENSEPQRNIVLESNCRDKSEGVSASSSTIKKVLEPSIAIKCIDFPRSGKEIHT